LAINVLLFRLSQVKKGIQKNEHWGGAKGEGRRGGGISMDE